MNRVTTSKWLKGVAYEVAFWKNVYRWDKTFEGMMGWSHYGGIIQLEEFDALAFLSEKTEPLVLDVGCGMSYATGNYIGENDHKIPLNIRYIDPLASHFNRILQRYQRNLPEIEFGMMEYLSAFYKDKDVSLIIIQNALDHSLYPTKSILEAISTLQIGGVLYLNHHPNEAIVEHYKGFHQYNIEEKDNQLFIWNQHQRISVNELVRDFADIEVKSHNNGHVIAIIRKRDELPGNCLKTEKDIRQLCEEMINFNETNASVFAAVVNKFRYWKYNTIQFFVQSLSWETKMRLKKLIKQT